MPLTEAGTRQQAASVSLKTGEEVLAVYESLVLMTRAMLELARSQRWEELIRQQARYVVEVETLRRQEKGLALDADQQAHKALMLETILGNDLAIRDLLLARRDEIGERLGTAQRRRSLNRVYRQGGAVPPGEAQMPDER
ncbi:flagellar protein FliT [Parahaliea mediterranea]|uniref:flagellar protein FliT n=1 Tax=Parahaliea mediterranea TaxID=651086 RepID=UPI0013006340|nr:flagellar protein FliT [Parahaliea mediterranea]